MLAEWNDVITAVPELYPEEEHTAGKAQMPQVVYKKLSNTNWCGFPFFIITDLFFK